MNPQNVPSNQPAVARDADTIEPEWIAKEKAIVQQYSGNPFKQAEALNALKADYMRQRYNKVIKVAE